MQKMRFSEKHSVSTESELGMKEKDIKDRDTNAVPSRGLCIELLKRHHVPEHIIAHSLQVDRVARFLGNALNSDGEQLDMGLVEAAALLHDITKLDGIKTGRNHAKTGGELLESLGYPRVAEVVAHHVMVPHDPKLIRVTEDELVNYADKRVMHDRIVTLEARYLDLTERYGQRPGSKPLIRAAMERAREIEEKIFNRMSFHPNELVDILENNR